VTQEDFDIAFVDVLEATKAALLIEFFDWRLFGADKHLLFIHFSLSMINLFNISCKIAMVMWAAFLLEGALCTGRSQS
jgi:hypothetical protein